MRVPSFKIARIIRGVESTENLSGSNFLTLRSWHIIARNYICGSAVLSLIFSAFTLFWGKPNDFQVALICGGYVALQGFWDCFSSVGLKRSNSQTFQENTSDQKISINFFTSFVYGLSLPGILKLIIGIILLLLGASISHVVLVGLLAAFLGINFFENSFFIWIINTSPLKDIKTVRSLRNDFAIVALVYIIGCIIMISVTNSDAHAVLGVMSNVAIVTGILNAVTVFTNIFNERDVKNS